MRPWYRGPIPRHPTTVATHPPPVNCAGADPCEALSTATDDDSPAFRENGEPVLVCGSLDEVPFDRECVTLQGLAPKVCGVLGNISLSAESFRTRIQDAVPSTDASRQASCETPPR